MEFARLAANTYISLVLDCRDYADHYQNLKEKDCKDIIIEVLARVSALIPHYTDFEALAPANNTIKTNPRFHLQHDIQPILIRSRENASYSIV